MASAVIGAAAAYAAVYNQNALLGFLVFGGGVILLFVIGGAVMLPGLMQTPEVFFELVGPGGLVAAVVGAVAGAYAAERQRQG